MCEDVTVSLIGMTAWHWRVSLQPKNRKENEKKKGKTCRTAWHWGGSLHPKNRKGIFFSKKRKWKKKRKNLQDSLAKGVRADAEGLKGVCTKSQPVYRLQVHLKKKKRKHIGSLLTLVGQ